MISIKKFLIFRKLSHIPAIIQIVRANIRNGNQRAVCFQHEHMGHGSRPDSIHGMTQIIQQTMVFQQIFHGICRCHGAATGCDLIGQPPAYNRRMIIALCNQLPHLVKSVPAAIWHVLGDVWDFRPDDQPIFITKVIKFLCVLIMSQSNRVCANLLDDLHIFFMFFYGQGVSKARAVLMAAHPP